MYRQDSWISQQIACDQITSCQIEYIVVLGWKSIPINYFNQRFPCQNDLFIVFFTIPLKNSNDKSSKVVPALEINQMLQMQSKQLIC